jgi:hypothetical protein
VWAGAARIANADASAPMARHTPIFIASVTKMCAADTRQQGLPK